MEDGEWRMEGGGWRTEGGGWKAKDGGWRLEDGGWRVEDGEVSARVSELVLPSRSLQFSKAILRWQGCSLLEAEPWGWLVCNSRGRKVFQKNDYLSCKAGRALQERKRSESKLAHTN